MDYHVYLERMTNLLEVQQPLVSEAVFEELEGWDSLKVLSILAFADKEFGKVLSMGALASCKTVQELYRLLTQS